MSKFKIGEVVRIRKDAKAIFNQQCDFIKDTVGWNDDMNPLCGEEGTVVTIPDAENPSYEVKVGNNLPWSFAEECLISPNEPYAIVSENCSCGCHCPPEEKSESNLVRHARAELELLLTGDKVEDSMQQTMNDDILEIVKLFASHGHSGFSASYALSLLKKVLTYEPITPLTGADSEWMNVDGKTLFQNVRCGHVFKENGVAYDIDGIVFEDKSTGNRWTGKGSWVNITFPYTPARKVVIVDDTAPPTGPQIQVP